jgi:hypothetical protein
LSELADYRKIHGDCNVPRKYRKLKAKGNKPKDAIQVAARRKGIAYHTLPYPGIGKPGFWREASVLVKRTPQKLGPRR